MKLFLYAGAASVAFGCKCPDFVTALSNGMSISASMGNGAVVLPPCCEDLLKYKNILAQGGLLSKHTPGGSCADLNTCGSCTVLSFCRWHNPAHAGAANFAAGEPKHGASGCVDTTYIEELDAGEYVSKCAAIDMLYYEGAEIRADAAVDADKYPHIPESVKVDLVGPKVAYQDTQWPTEFDGYLPPKTGCSVAGLSQAEIDKKYPSGLPSCGDYVNEGVTLHSGHQTTDIVSDPRLPVETHRPGYPLGANSQLPDHLVEGGDFAMEQPLSPWVEPAFNHNGCIGGPCDAPSQHACTGLSCSHNINNGNDIHDEKVGTVYKRDHEKSHDTDRGATGKIGKGGQGAQGELEGVGL
jgi:hypothetical protein